MADDKLVSRLLLIGLAVVVLSILVAQYFSIRKNDQAGGGKGPSYGIAGSREMFSVPSPSHSPASTAATFVSQETNPPLSQSKGPGSNVMPSEPLQNEMFKSVNYAAAASSKGMGESCGSRDKVTADDLLPKDAANSRWAEVSPAGQGDVKDQNYLTAGYLVGVNTVGESLRNANYQLRSDPPIERVNVGPWQMSTIEGENRRYLEIGC